MPIAALVGFVIGVAVLQLQSSLPSALTMTLVAAAALGALVIARLRTLRTTPLAAVLVVLSCAALGFHWAGTRSQLRLADQLSFEDEGRDIRVEGAIASLPARLERGHRFEFEVERVLDPSVAVPQRLLLGWYAPGLQLAPGERWQLTVRLRRPHGVLNPGGFDFEAWLLERNLRATGYVRPTPAALRLQSMVWRPTLMVERARALLRDQLQPRLANERYGGVLLALILGDQRAIGAADWTLFSRTGISHLVSISGLHITMIAGLVALIVAAAWRRAPLLPTIAAAQTAAVVSGMLAAFAYALLAGWGVPAQRTVLMLTVVAVAWLARGRIALPTALAVAAAAVCIMDPWAVLAPGFWLSFGAVAAIAWIAIGRRSAPGWRDWRALLIGAARVQLAVTLALVPALVVLFHQLPLVSPVANAVAIPVISWVVTPVALLGAALAALPAPVDGLAQPLLALAHAVFGVLASFLAALAAPAWATWPVATPPAPLLLLAVIGVVIALAPPGWPGRSAGALALLPMLLWPAPRPAAGELWITVLDVGQGSAVLLETARSVWLYDAGPRHSAEADAGERVILPYLRHRGIGRLDGLIVSHLDSDHSGGAASILRATPVETVVSSIAAGHAALGGRTSVEACTAGDRFGDVVANGEAGLLLQILHPKPADYLRRRSTNSMSCVVQVQFGALRALLPGDIPAADEFDLEQSESLASDWLLVPHHGSRSSSTEAFVAAVQPRWAAVQAGYRNRFGHPDGAVLARDRARQTQLARTDWHGAVQWRYRADGEAEVSAFRRTAARYWHNQPDQGALHPAEVDGAAPDDAVFSPIGG